MLDAFPAHRMGPSGMCQPTTKGGASLLPLLGPALPQSHKVLIYLPLPGNVPMDRISQRRSLVRTCRQEEKCHLEQVLCALKLPHALIWALGMKLPKHEVNAQLHRSAGRRPQLSLFVHVPQFFPPAFGQNSALSERRRLEIKGESTNCIAFQAALVKAWGEGEPDDQNE